MKTIISTPKKDGFRTPGEFEKHSGCWMLWPERPDIWLNNATPAQKIFSEIANNISQHEKLTMGVSSNQEKNARKQLSREIELFVIEYDDAWPRDYGPVFVCNEEDVIRGVDWEFNAWGGKDEGSYYPWDKDNALAKKILEIENIDRYKSNMVLEGGSIQVDGKGTLMVTKGCILNKNRNPGLSKEEIEWFLTEYLNIKKIIWFNRGIVNEENNGHMDNLCTFIKPGEVLLHWTDDKDDPQYEISKEAYDILTTNTDAQGRSLKINKIHQPGPLYITEEEVKGLVPVETTIRRIIGDRMPASYLNYYTSNGSVIFPSFNDKWDNNAKEIFSNLFPDKDIIPIHSRVLALAGGAIHCVTQHIPEHLRKTIN